MHRRLRLITTIKALAFSFATLKRDWRSGEMRLIGAALIIAVGAVTAVTFFTDRVRQAMEIQTSTLLAADIAVESIQPIPDSLSAKARALGLQTAQTSSFRSMVAAGEKLQLAEVKAVDSTYPLRGELLIAERPFGPSVEAHQIPEKNTVWADIQLLQILALSVGDVVELGASRFVVSKVLTLEPDRGGEIFHIAPRVMMNLNDVPATGLLSVGSRARHRLLVAGERHSVENYRAWLDRHLPEGARLVSVRTARPELRVTLERGERFLGLTALTSVLIAGVAIATTARRYAARHLDNCAIMRCVGATQGFIIRVYALTMLWLGLITSLIGCLVGLAAHFGLARLITGLTVGDLPPPSMLPLPTGILIGLIALLGFAMPPLLELKDVPPGRVLRREAIASRRPSWAVYLGAILAIASLVTWQAGEGRLTVYVLAGSLLTVIVLASASWLLVQGLGALRSRVGVSWRFGFTNIARRVRSSVIQTVALGLGIMVMLLLSVVRSELLANWQAKLPLDTPNHFVVNIHPDEGTAIRQFFAQRALPVPVLYPIIHGRLYAINGEPVDPVEYADPRARRLVKREFHLSWLSDPPEDNRIVAGDWWSSNLKDSQQFSLETGIAETLRIELDDTLTFLITDRQVTGRVTSLRSVDWASFHPNFFFIAPPRLLDEFSTTFMTSFYLPESRKNMLIELVRAFPGVTILDVAALITQIKAIMDRVALAVEFILLFTLLAGLLVLFAASQSMHDERLHESAVLRTLGANKLTIIRGLAAEFLSLGAVAGLVAALGAMVIGYVLAEHMFNSEFHFNPWLLILGLLGGALGVGIAGLLGTRSVLHTAPIETLRRV